MNKRLDRLLVKKHPLLFAHRFKNMKETAMCWGFECGDGWYKHIKELADKLEVLIQQYIGEHSDGVKDYGHPTASQVKEKYGTLCFYMTYATNEMWDLIGKAEDASAKICETCGKPGKLRGKGWYYTACNKHVKDTY